MAVIIKKGKAMDKTAAYTWGGCAVAFVMVISLLMSFMGGPQDDSANFAGITEKSYQDLALLPFINDSAEEELLAKYSDIAGNMPLETLYSEEERAEREELDSLNPWSDLPSDTEYAEAKEEQEYQAAVRESYSSPSRSRTPVTPTRINTMSGGGSMASYRGGGGSGGGTWSGVSSSRGNVSNTKSTSALPAAAQDKLKNTRLLHAAQTSKDASKKDGDAAAQGAIDAMHGGGGKVDASLMDDAKPAIDGDALAKALEAKGSGDAKNLADAIKDGSKPENPKGSSGPSTLDELCAMKEYRKANSWDCTWMPMLVEVGKQAVTKLALNVVNMPFKNN